MLQEVAKRAVSTVLFLEYGYGITFRRNGMIIRGSKRDAVDTGKLMDSLKIQKTKQGFSIKFTTEYADKVFAERPEIPELIRKSIDYELLAAYRVYEVFKKRNLTNDQKVKRRNKRAQGRRKRKNASL
jgi:hypothetical protein